MPAFLLLSTRPGLKHLGPQFHLMPRRDHYWISTMLCTEMSAQGTFLKITVAPRKQFKIFGPPSGYTCPLNQIFNHNHVSEATKQLYLSNPSRFFMFN